MREDPMVAELDDWGRRMRLLGQFGVCEKMSKARQQYQYKDKMLGFAENDFVNAKFECETELANAKDMWTELIKEIKESVKAA